MTFAPYITSRSEVRTDLSLLGTQLDNLLEQLNTPTSGASESLNSSEVLVDQTEAVLMIELFDELSQMQVLVLQNEAYLKALIGNTSDGTG